MVEPLPIWETHDVGYLREFSWIRLIALDIDGTLQTDNVQLFDTLLRQQRQLHTRRARVELTIATGRTLTGVRPLLAKCKFSKNVPLILYNGSVILKNSSFKILRRTDIARSALSAILKLCENYNATVLAYFFCDEPEHLLGRKAGLEYVLGWSCTQRPDFDFNQMPIDWKDDWCHETEQQAIAVLIEPHSAAELPELAEALSGVNGVTITQSGSSYLEVRPAGSNKGTALRAVSEMTGLTRREVLALGDNDNDAEMLDWAGIGVSVAGASEGAISNSNYVCRHGVASGVVEILRLIINAKRFFAAEAVATETKDEP